MRGPGPIILNVATASLIQAAASPGYFPAGPPLPGYGVEQVQWSFKPPFGKPIFVNGTVQDVRPTLGDTGHTQPESRDEDVHPVAPGQQKRTAAKDDMAVKFCGIFPMANSHHISAQVPSIVTVSGPAVIGPGPANCAQVSCAQKSAIWWCNDNNTTVMLPHGMGQLGDAVDAIIDQCCVTTSCREPPGFAISGQAFSDEGWNILVRGGEC